MRARRAGRASQGQVSGAPRTVVHPGTRENLPRFLHFIEDVCARIEASAEIKYALRLAVEEICTNLIHYGYRGRPAGPIEVAVHDARDRVTIVIRDRSPPFDPVNAPAPESDVRVGS